MTESPKSLRQIAISLFLLFSFTAFCAAQQPTAAAQPRPQPPRRARRATAAHLSASPANATGSCPANIGFSGTITANGPTEVKYTWESFDGGTWPERTLKFAKAGTEKVGERVHQGGAGQTIHGWMRIKVLSPDTLYSNKALYTIRCTAAKK